MIRRISALALGFSVSLLAVNAFAQDDSSGGGDDKGGDAAAGGGDEKPAGDSAGGDKAAGGGEAKAGGEAAASTEGVPDSGGKIKIGLRLGYGIPMGDAAKNVKLSDGVSGMIPIWLDLGYMVTPNIMVGLYGQYGIVMLASKVKDACSAANVSCSAHDIRIGIQGQYHISPGQSLDPWVGLGIGYEMLGESINNVSSTTKGLEFANIQVGADFGVANNLTVGPFVSFSLGQFSSVSSDAGSADIVDKGMHQWLVLGVKGTYGL